ncbi:50S ribosomal protein L18 [bacterium]|nr:50S ribosomal protein L18 [bacterium]
MSKVTPRERRKKRVRKILSGTESRPRVFVFKSNKYLHAGVADDIAGKVLFGATGAKNTAGASKLAEEIAKLLKSKKLSEAVFDRSGYKYHGVLAKFTDTLREKGIKI